MEVLERTYKVTDFLQKEDFEENFIYELLNGTIVKRSAPNPLHQIVLLNLVRVFDNFIQRNKQGVLLIAPIDVILDEGNLVVPDLIFVQESRKNIITEKGIEGIPDLVVEI
ncbi:MAG: Uma2 family endonuclease, partial [Raineya sp.]|nr:Uma2 family endonuclease [Raineya sp.]